MNQTPRNDPHIDCCFPGGNILVERIDGDDVWVRQDLRDTQGDWFYWCFRVRSAQRRTITFHFTGSDVIGVRGPGVSLDNGVSWQWLGQDAVDAKSFTHVFSKQDNDVRFSFGMPYQESHMQAFLDSCQGHPALSVDSLCRTRAGRSVERLHLGCTSAEPDHRVLLTCRHHCCEMMASYALEGIIAYTLGKTCTAEWLREHG